MTRVLDIELDAVDKARFWVWVTKSESCWEWEGYRNKKGYGFFGGIRCGRRLVHRISWVIANGPIPDDLAIDHACHNTACVRPEHLRLATVKQNAENLRPVRSASGYRGVYRYNKTKWRGVVRHEGIDHATPAFHTPEEANEAITALRNELFTHNILDRQPA